MRWLRRGQVVAGIGDGARRSRRTTATRRRRLWRGSGLAIALSLAAGCSPLLDTGFGDGTGVLTLDDPVGVSDNIPGAVAVQPDGKIVVLFSNSAYLSIVRLEPDGTLDDTFGTDGRLDTGLNGGWSCADLEVQADGKYLVSSYLYPGSASGVTRYNPDGSLDTSFGVGGSTAVDIDAPDETCDLALQPDGKIVAAVDDHNTGMMLTRWNADGTVDTGFGTNGFAENWVQDRPTHPALRQWTTAIAVLPDGRIVAAGGGTEHVDPASNPPRHVVVARFNPDGSIDTTFGRQGGRIDDLGGTAVDMAARPDGRILVTGTVHPRYSSNGEAQFFLAQYDAAGTRDATFGAGGLAHAVDDGSAKAVTLLADDKILVVGGEWPDAHGTDPHDGLILIRYLGDGRLDDSFGQHGISTTDHFDGNEGAVDAAVQPDGKLVVIGTVRHSGQQSHDELGIFRFRAG